MPPGEYTIGGGEAEADRLSRQADVMVGASHAFLMRSGLELGGACVDVGCGQGNVSVDMARVVGPGGRVVGIDADPEALRSAKSAADQAGVHVEFVCADAHESIAGPPFDLAYCRLLLSHLIEPLAAVRIMRDAVRPGGVVAVEDLLTGTLRSEPARPVLEELQDLYASTVRAHGGDPTIGPRLRAMLTAGGLQEVDERVVVNPMQSVAEKLFLSELIDNMRRSILEAGAANEVEIDSIVQRTEEAARDPSTVFYQADIYQVSGRRPLRDDRS
jgi:ubiquinone/menaquinone biosynthesis C-methylase UbiE